MDIIKPPNQTFTEVPKQKGQTVLVGILIAIIILLLAVGFYLFKIKNVEVQVPTPTVEKTAQLETTGPITETQSEQAESAANQSTQSEQTNDPSSASDSQSAIDFEYELKQLDTQANSVSSTDLSETEMSDIKSGL